MATNAEILAALKTLALTQATGGGVESYILPDGTSIRITPATDLKKLIAEYEGDAEAEAGASRFRLARLRPA